MKTTVYAFLNVAVLLLLGIVATPGSRADSRNPYLKPDESWISISGIAVEAQSESFILDYGEGTITVEMDKWKWYEKVRQVLEGDKVTVYGKIDDDLYETVTIEAASVYVEGLGTYFYAGPGDEEKFDAGRDYWVYEEPLTVRSTTIRGTVSGVQDREFTIDMGPRKLTIDTTKMAYNPLDQKGYQRIEKGDYVRVTGEMKKNFWEKRRLMADTVITLRDNRKSTP